MRGKSRSKDGGDIKGLKRRVPATLGGDGEVLQITTKRRQNLRMCRKRKREREREFFVVPICL